VTGRACAAHATNYVMAGCSTATDSTGSHWMPSATPPAAARKQDPSLSFPSQFEAGRKRVAEMGGSVICEFTDEQTGADDDRPGWSELIAEARDRGHRRFDGVVLYSTSRLSRDRVSAGLFERELRKLGVSVVYAHAAPTPPRPRAN
jgi:hypothetical protein